MNINGTTSNIFSDVALFQLMMNQTQVIFETDSKELIEHLLEVFKSNKVYKKTTFTINTKYINHSIIEDGYYTFSQIYQHHNVLKYTIVNTPFTKNNAEIVSEWFEFMIDFEKETGHWKVHHLMFANQADGSDMFEPDYTGARPLYIGSYSDNLLIKSKVASDYNWESTPAGELPKESIDKFNFSTQLTKELVSVKGQSPINKRNLRNDSWHYEANENYPEIGGYES